MADDSQTGSLEIKCEPASPQPDSSPKMTIDESPPNGVIKTEKEEEQDQPLDFSCRGRKRSVSPSASSSPQPSSPICSKHSENGDVSNDEHSRSHSNSSASDSDNKIGEPRLAKPGTVPGTVFPGMIPGILPNFAGLPSGLSTLGAAANLFNSMSPSALASMLDQRKTNQQGNKGSRPFKAYPKDPLSLSTLPQGYPYGVPAFLPITSAGMSIPTQDAISAQSLNQSSEELFHIYRQQVLKAQDDLRKTKGKNSSEPPTSESPPLPEEPSVSNHSSPTSSTTSTTNSRKRPRIYPDSAKDESYWDRRRKNNEAAKRSRDARRAKEDEIAIRAAFLEQENLKLRVEVAALKTETAKLRVMLLNNS